MPKIGETWVTEWRGFIIGEDGGLWRLTGVRLQHVEDGPPKVTEYCVRCGGRWHLGGSSQLATCSPQNYLGVREVLRGDRSLGSSLEDRRDRSPQPLQQCPDAHSLRALEDRRVARRACSTHGVAAHTLTLATRLN